VAHRRHPRISLPFAYRRCRGECRCRCQMRHTRVTAGPHRLWKWTKGKAYGSRTCKPNSVRQIAPAGRSFLWATHRCGALATYPKVGRAEPARARSRSRELPSYLVLLRVWFALPAALLPRRCALTAPFHPYPHSKMPAVCFLWHFPSDGLEPGLPDVIRHTALRSSDFPLPTPEDAESDRPVQLPTDSLYARADLGPRTPDLIRPDSGHR
jgi:hypothetical protein